MSHINEENDAYWARRFVEIAKEGGPYTWPCTLELLFIFHKTITQFKLLEHQLSKNPNVEQQQLAQVLTPLFLNPAMKDTLKYLDYLFVEMCNGNKNPDMAFGYKNKTGGPRIENFRRDLWIAESVSQCVKGTFLNQKGITNKWVKKSKRELDEHIEQFKQINCPAKTDNAFTLGDAYKIIGSLIGKEDSSVRVAYEKMKDIFPELALSKATKFPPPLSIPLNLGICKAPPANIMFSSASIITENDKADKPE